MNIGVSTYSLSRAIIAGELTVDRAVASIAEIGGRHVEVVPVGFDLTRNPELIDAIRRAAADAGIRISNYAVGANFAVDEAGACEREIERVKREVDIAARLGAKRMRHDVAPARVADMSVRAFLADLPRLAEACGTIAEYAQAYGITTSVENHGYYVQGSDRVLALIHSVDCPNFRMTVDIGNFLCTDEEPVAAAKKCLPYASMVHIKDFYVRPASRNPGHGWFQTAGGNRLRGAIAGHGDIDLPAALRAIRQSGYEGDISLEFEGLEECRLGTRLGLEYVKRLWEEEIE